MACIYNTNQTVEINEGFKNKATRHIAWREMFVFSDETI